MVYGNVEDKKVAYMHCPRCGSFHRRSVHGFSESAEYRCGDCIQKEVFLQKRFRKCAYCGKTASGQINESTVLTVMCPLVDPTDKTFDPLSDKDSDNIFQRLYFCKTHFAIAKRFAWGVPKDALWKTIKKKESEKMLRQANNMYRGAKIY